MEKDSYVFLGFFLQRTPLITFPAGATNTGVYILQAPLIKLVIIIGSVGEKWKRIATSFWDFFYKGQGVFLNNKSSFRFTGKQGIRY